MPGAVTLEKTTATGEERDTMETDIGNKVQETEQELAPQDQICAKQMTTPEEKRTMTNADYVRKRGHWAKICRNCFTCGSSTQSKQNCPGNQWTERTNVIRACSTNKTKCFNVELLLNGKLVTRLLDSGRSMKLKSFDTCERLGKPGSINFF